MASLCSWGAPASPGDTSLGAATRHQRLQHHHHHNHNHHHTSTPSSRWDVLLALAAILAFNWLVVGRLVGNRLLSDGATLRGPGGWLLFHTLGSLSFLVLGLLLALWRLVLLLLTSLLALGR